MSWDRLVNDRRYCDSGHPVYLYDSLLTPQNPIINTGRCAHCANFIVWVCKRDDENYYGNHRYRCDEHMRFMSDELG